MTLARLFATGAPLCVQRRNDVHEALFTVVDGSLRSAFLVKTSTSPKAWQFTFTGAELEAIRSPALDTKFEQRFALLACKMDGVCCLSASELALLFAGVSHGSKVIGVSRPRAGRYRVSGPGRNPLGYTVPASHWPHKVLRGYQA